MTKDMIQVSGNKAIRCVASIYDYSKKFPFQRVPEICKEVADVSCSCSGSIF